MDNSIVKISIIAGIISGIIASVLVNRHYTKKNKLIAKIKYLRDLQNCVIRLEKECNHLLFYEASYENYKITLNVLLNISNIYLPSNFRIKLTEHEEIVVDQIMEIYFDIKRITSSIWHSNDFMYDLVNNYYSTKKSESDNETCEQMLNEKIEEIEGIKMKLKHECSKFEILKSRIDYLVIMKMNKLSSYIEYFLGDESNNDYQVTDNEFAESSMRRNM